MTILIADVGGSNSRLALAKNAQDVPRQIGHFNNADFTSFDAVVEAYLARERPGKITACSIALAGPVTSDVGALTNRDWTISSTDLRLKLGCDAVCLLNDLTALGFAIDALPEAELKNISPGARVMKGRHTGSRKQILDRLEPFRLCNSRGPQPVNNRIGQRHMPGLNLKARRCF